MHQLATKCIPSQAWRRVRVLQLSLRFKDAAA
jgi:hypothetical protein